MSSEKRNPTRNPLYSEVSFSLSKSKTSKSIITCKTVNESTMDAIRKNKNVMDEFKSQQMSLKNVPSNDLSIIYDVIKPFTDQRIKFRQCVDRLERMLIITEHKKCKLEARLKTLDEEEKNHVHAMLLKVIKCRDVNRKCRKLQNNLVTDYRNDYSNFCDIKNNKNDGHTFKQQILKKRTETSSNNENELISFRPSNFRSKSVDPCLLPGNTMSCEKLSKNYSEIQALIKLPKALTGTTLNRKSSSSTNLRKPSESKDILLGHNKRIITKDKPKLPVSGRLSITNDKLFACLQHEENEVNKHKKTEMKHAEIIRGSFIQIGNILNDIKDEILNKSIDDHVRIDIDKSKTQLGGVFVDIDDQNVNTANVELPLLIINDLQKIDNHTDNSNMLYKILMKFDSVKQLIEKRKRLQNKSKLKTKENGARSYRHIKTKDIIDWLKMNQQYHADSLRSTDAKPARSEQLPGSYVSDKLSTIYFIANQSMGNNVGNEIFSDVTIEPEEDSWITNGDTSPNFNRSVNGANICNGDNVRKSTDEYCGNQTCSKTNENRL